MSPVPNQRGQCDGAAAPRSVGGGSPPRGGSVLLERNARLRGKGVITAGLQAALFHPILSEVPEKAFGKARRKYARMSAEIAVGQLE